MEREEPARADANDPPAEEAALWDEWLRTQSAEARTALVDCYLPFVRVLAAKYYRNRHIAELAFDDFMHFGIVGMLEALDSFDHRRRVPFKPFAAHRIIGSILNGVEKLNDRQEQVSLRKRIRQQRLESLRMPGEEREKKVDKFKDLMEIGIGLALGFMLEGSGMYQADEPSHEQDVYSRHDLQQLQQALKSVVDILPEQERRVIRYHYFQNVQFEEVARILGLTKGRISQIHKSALLRMRAIYTSQNRVNLSI